MTDPTPVPATAVVGFGSIGARHARVLAALGQEVAVVSRRGGAGHYPDLASAFAAHPIGYVVIATETADHGRVLDQLAATGFAGAVLVEKPLFATPRALPRHRFARIGVGYDLRFHPALIRLRTRLVGERILSAQIYCGQYLPEWRPTRDYRTVYSASAGLGGGVLRDLSHELDYANWLFGPWRRLAASGGRWSDLVIDSDDTFAILAEFQNCPAATLQINYTDRQTRREVVVNTADHTFRLDLIGATLRCDGEAPERFELPRDYLWFQLHESVLVKDAGLLCDAEAGLLAVDMVAAIEQAAQDRVWVTRDLSESRAAG